MMSRRGKGKKTALAGHQSGRATPPTIAAGPQVSRAERDPLIHPCTSLISHLFILPRIIIFYTPYISNSGLLVVPTVPFRFPLYTSLCAHRRVLLVCQLSSTSSPLATHPAILVSSLILHTHLLLKLTGVLATSRTLEEKTAIFFNKLYVLHWQHGTPNAKR